MEWLYHIGVPESEIEDMAANSANTVPVMMPYIDAFFMPRAYGDRPKVVPDGAVNFAFLGQFASTFPQAYFLRCHRGYIVNIMHACQYTQKFIKFNTGVEIPIGRNFMEETLNRLQQYFYSEAHV